MSHAATLDIQVLPIVGNVCVFAGRNPAMHQQVTGNFSSAVVPNSSVGSQPLGSISDPLQAPAGFQSPHTTPGMTNKTVLGSTPSTFPNMATGTRPGMTPDITPSIVPSIGTDMNPGNTTLGKAPSSASDTAPGSYSNAMMDMMAAAPISNNAPIAAAVPGQAATPSRQPMLQSQKRKALIKPASPGTQHGRTRQKSSVMECEPLDDHGLHDGNTGDPQQQVLCPRAVAAAEVHHQNPDGTTALSSSKKRRKKLLQQCVLPFQAANGEPSTAFDKPPITAMSRAKKPSKQPVSLAHLNASYITPLTC